jgi:hypothetical protein
MNHRLWLSLFKPTLLTCETLNPYPTLRKEREELMEPHGQSPWFPRDAHKGRTSRTRGPIHPRAEPVVLLVRDRIYQIPSHLIVVS